MDADTRWLFDPSSTRALVLAHRPPEASAVDCVVSDVVWQDVVRLLRWARVSTEGAPGLEAGVLWRLAAGCGDLLRRIPGLGEEIAEPWRSADPAAAPDDLTPAQRIDRAAERLTALLRRPVPVPLRQLATEVDLLGEAAVLALAA